MKKIWFGAALVLLGAGCAGPKTKTVSAKSQESTLGRLLSDEQRLLKDSELHIIFPQLQGASTKHISLKAEKSQILASTTVGREELRQGVLSIEDFRTIIEKLKPLEEGHFEQKIAQNCKDPFTFKVRSASDQKTFLGCRGSGPSASIISKTARDIEYLLIRSDAGHKGYSSPTN